MRMNFNQMRLPIILKSRMDMILNEFTELQPNAFENYFHKRLPNGYTDIPLSLLMSYDIKTHGMAPTVAPTDTFIIQCLRTEIQFHRCQLLL